MKITFIRHAMTYGNSMKRYIGVTDEELCGEGIEKLNKMVNAGCYPDCEVVYASPMVRCKRTAQIIYPDKRIVYEKAFTECDFGRFEGKNYAELDGDEEFQRWIDSGGKLPFPDGEDIQEFKNRCVSGFCKVVEIYSKFNPNVRQNVKKNERLDLDLSGKFSESGIALVVHGGTIMSVMEAFEENHRDYYEYHVKNCEGYETVFDGRELKIMRVIKNRM